MATFWTRWCYMYIPSNDQFIAQTKVTMDILCQKYYECDLPYAWKNKSFTRVHVHVTWLKLNVLISLHIHGEATFPLPQKVLPVIELSRNVKLIRYQFWCTSCAFRLLKSLQWYSGRKKKWKSEGKKIVKTVQEPKNPYIVLWHWAKSLKDRAMHEGDNPSFWDEFINLLFSW
jgi:hypothetical protein